MNRLTTSRGRGWLVASTAAALMAIAALVPTGAEAAPNTLKATTSDFNATGSCDFRVTRLHPNGGNPTITARVTMKAAEIKPSFFAPRRVANIVVQCVVASLVGPGGGIPLGTQTLQKLNNGSTVYKTQYVTMPLSDRYRVCVQVQYMLLNGTTGSTPMVCNPAA